ncbi:hypothetical protein N0V82_009408 [Gnomoniopsis sp. IMI 355080]|nr:hypothetical protein N0V82_009408 [Gnomoniopsis sp. IMI 355080]
MSAPNSNTTVGCRPKGAIIISGYVCIGKTYFCHNISAEKRHEFGRIVDLDSSKYSRDQFPENYLQDIRRTADQYAQEGCVILVSTFPGVATKLRQDGYYVAQVYPQKSPETKLEWLRRLEFREKEGKESRLYRLVDQHWDEWFDEMETRDISKSIRVAPNEYLSNVIDKIYQHYKDSK